MKLWVALYAMIWIVLILFFHVINAFAIITQAAAVAIAYDMWEDHEFVKETEPGIVPPLPMPCHNKRCPIPHQIALNRVTEKLAVLPVPAHFHNEQGLQSK
jgi:hypothetical protein